MTRMRVLEVAMHEFTKNSFNDVQARDIAKKAGVAHGIVFHYFNNKRTLFIESVQVMAERLFDVPDTTENLAPYYRIRKNLSALFTRMAENEDLFLAYVRNSSALENDPDVMQTLTKYEYQIMSWLFDEDQNFTLENSIPMRFLHIVHSSVDRLVAEWIAQKYPHSIEDLVEAALEIVIGGMKAAQHFEPSPILEKTIEIISVKPS